MTTDNRGTTVSMTGRERRSTRKRTKKQRRKRPFSGSSVTTTTTTILSMCRQIFVHVGNLVGDGAPFAEATAVGVGSKTVNTSGA